MKNLQTKLTLAALTILILLTCPIVPPAQAASFDISMTADGFVPAYLEVTVGIGGMTTTIFSITIPRTATATRGIQGRSMSTMVYTSTRPRQAVMTMLTIGALSVRVRW